MKSDLTIWELCCKVDITFTYITKLEIYSSISGVVKRMGKNGRHKCRKCRKCLHETKSTVSCKHFRHFQSNFQSNFRLMEKKW